MTDLKLSCKNVNVLKYISVKRHFVLPQALFICHTIGVDVGLFIYLFMKLGFCDYYIGEDISLKNVHSQKYTRKYIV